MIHAITQRTVGAIPTAKPALHACISQQLQRQNILANGDREKHKANIYRIALAKNWDTRTATLV